MRLLNPNPANDWRKGDPFWVYDPWTKTIIADRIATDRLIRSGHGQGKILFLVSETGRTYPADTAFWTRQQAEAALTAFREKVKHCKEQMRDLETTLRYASEYIVDDAPYETRHAIRAAFEERIRELLGIDLTDTQGGKNNG